ncbi:MULTISPECIES: copper chaperone CopZ [Fictibacillus]|uniref:copper chaperone CopZ n=1 Tax=Fictibacillus TaxID=1329200 RepID=UPI0018CE11F6|nr:MULTISPECIES: copper chaperone CopZ [unclassified Fictibacillus]MBH0154967.1 copper chaperone CopZ [Fictibacillus sp. 5RED26]MBH0162486.1 copper chaperone CopZ [Fictibacillus sp. 26RED30]MBH0165250.1 copper chaperone CopZ [Fictibacillus sp. 7GRE50]MBH0172157.1 copper chaperone CopZ [Fictibacillus sp. 23RED33]
METKTLNVEGMTCGHCKASVTNALNELDGVKNVVVHLETGKVDVEVDSSKVTDAEMREAIEDQGFDVK